jgi:hypothetical protein
MAVLRCYVCVPPINVGNKWLILIKYDMSVISSRPTEACVSLISSNNMAKQPYEIVAPLGVLVCS